jgi:hypothetical protein
MRERRKKGRLRGKRNKKEKQAARKEQGIKKERKTAKMHARNKGQEGRKEGRLFGRRREFPNREKLNGIYTKTVYKLRTKIYLRPFSFFPALGTRIPVGLSCSELMQK